MRWRKQVAGVQALDKDLEGLLSAWFDVGLLELRPLTWDSPASLLEKLIIYEAVHEIQSWDDLRHRVAPDRRCYAYFHPQMPDVPLIFVEVAFAGSMADNVQTVLDSAAPACWRPRRSGGPRTSAALRIRSAGGRVPTGVPGA